MLGSPLLAQTWVLSLCPFFSPLLGALFNGVCQGFHTIHTLMLDVVDYCRGHMYG